MKQNNDIKNVLIYCRESRDDGFINYERIETQRDILVTCCKNKNLGHIIDIIMDDNKSGTDFERLKPVKERIKNGEVDVLLLKDASRLGRNILESLTFTSFLEKHGVELVFESERYDEDIFPLIAWFNERRAKDDSEKIRRVLKHKMEEGEMVIKAPYGYIKKGSRLIIDNETAPVVKEIFDLFLNGHGKYEIAAFINRKGYPTPSQLKSQYENTKRTNIWNKQHIERILNHVIYTGDMPYGMRKKASFKSQKYLTVNKEDWIIIPDHHEPVISREDFEKAQALMRKNKKSKARNTYENPFSGLLFCGRCGSRMYRKVQRGKNAWYSCRKNNQEGGVKDHIRAGYGCYSHRIREMVLTDIVKKYINLLFAAPEFKNEIQTALESGESGRNKTEKEIAYTKNRIEALKTKASKVYDDKLNDKLPEYLFNDKIGEITKEVNKLTGSLEKLEKSLKEAEAAKDSKDNFINLIKRLNEKGINHQILNLLFQKILVFNPGDITAGIKDQYHIDNETYNGLYENGGVLFIQNFAFKAKINSCIGIS